MKNVLYITTDVSFLNRTDAGGGVVENSHLKLMKLNGYNIRILFLNTLLFSQKIKPNLVGSRNVPLFNNGMVKIDEIQLSMTETPKGIVSRIKNFSTDLTNYYYPFINNENTNFLKSYLKDLKIDFIWAQWFYSGLVCSRLKLKYPIFYVHHDWQYKLIKYKKKRSFKTLVLTEAKKKIERKFISKLTATICLSYSDYKILKDKNFITFYLPITYDSDLIKNKNKERIFPNLVHLGNLNTTANKVGLEYFFQFVWEEIKIQYPNIKLEIIGKEIRSNNEFMHKIKNDKNIIYYNYIENLEEVLYPYDIHIIPWNKDTGTRTRIPLIFKFKQCVVAMQQGVFNIKGIKSFENSMLANSWTDYTKKIIEAIENNSLRRNIADNGNKMYKETYIHNSQNKNLHSFITKVLKG